MIKKNILWAIVFGAFVLFVGGKLRDKPCPRPVAVAGADQTVTTGSLVTLDGQGRNPPRCGSLTFNWSLESKPEGSKAVLSDPTSTAPTFTPDVNGTYVLNLMVYDGRKESLLDPVTITRRCDLAEIFNNSEWVITRQETSIAEMPFAVTVDGNMCGMAKGITFASRVTGTTQFPQVMTINAAGFLRLKAGADMTPPLPFGQSLILGPAIFGSSSSFLGSTLFSNPQLQTVMIRTSSLNVEGTGDLRIQLIANDRGLPVNSTKTNQIMDLIWDLVLREPTDMYTQLKVAGQFTFTEAVQLDPVRTAEFQSFRLFQIASLFIDDRRHHVDAMSYRGMTGERVEFFYTPAHARILLPQDPVALDAENLTFNSLHTDHVGEPNGKTPSYKITVTQTKGPMTGSITPRAFFVSTEDVYNDNLNVWLHQDLSRQRIPAGTTGKIQYNVVATTDPFQPNRPKPHEQ